MNGIENTPAVVETTENKTKTKKTAKVAKVKNVLNKENTKVLNVIVKNPEITATKIGKKLRFNFTPTRALSILRDNKFVLVSKDKGYTVSAKGTAALAGAVKPKRTKTAKPVVAMEPAAEPAPAMEPAPVVEAPEMAAV